MLGRLGEYAATARDAAASVVGIRAGEQPKHEVIARLGEIEIRRYVCRLVAETRAAGGEQAARTAGFSRLAGYIFGGNEAGLRIAMTAPVAQLAEPVASRIRFFLPAGLTAAPSPNDPEVVLALLPEQSSAVLRFSGSDRPAAFAAAREKLLGGLPGSGWTPCGEAEAWFYDPPWTLPPLRRNEVAVPVARQG